jgi:NAD-dependent DNA ligase adenylation domain
MNEAEIMALINRKRRQVLVHSFLYYRMNTSIWSDHKFDQVANELVDLQRKYPEIAQKCAYHEYFQDFDGSSGFDLPLHLPEVVSAGIKLLRYHERKSRRDQNEKIL